MSSIVFRSFLNLLVFGFATGELVRPQFSPVQVEEIPSLAISTDDIREAFSYAQDQLHIRTQIENKYVETGNTYKPSDLSTDIRLIGVVFPKTMELDKNQKLFEDATKWISKKYNLTQDETRLGLENLTLPKDLQAVQQCMGFQEHSPCSEKNKYRTADGSCNNLENPNWGRAISCNNRMIKSTFADGFSSPRRSIDGSELPNPRFVSLTVVDDVDIPSPIVSQLVPGFAHFLGHDVSLAVSPLAGDKGTYLSCCPKNDSAVELPSVCFPIPLQKDDPDFTKWGRTCNSLVRNAACSETCKLGTPRGNVNQHTAFVDASPVYGVSDNETRTLRTLRGGTLTNQFFEEEELPPPSFNPEIDQCSETLVDNHTCFQTGDYRSSQLPGLASMHINFFREHNRIAKIISNDYPQLSDEEVFQETRRIIIAEVQVIAYKELLPILLSPDMMDFFELNVLIDGYTKYNPKVDPRLLTDHGVSAARFGHTLATRWNKEYSKNGEEEAEKLDVVDNNFRSPYVFGGRMKSITRGLYSQSTQSFDRHFIAPLTNGLLGATGKTDGIDHAAFNVQRGREVGAPSYTDVLQHCYKVNITSFDDLTLTMTKENVLKFKKAYRHPEDIDLYIGGFSEKPIENRVLGPTFACLTGQQYHNLKFGDRFYFEHENQAGSFSEGQLAVLRQTSLARILCDNAAVERITPYVFHVPDKNNTLVDCSTIPNLDFKNWMDK